eukprot:tig00020849_g14662.t1
MATVPAIRRAAAATGAGLRTIQAAAPVHSTASRAPSLALGLGPLPARPAALFSRALSGLAVSMHAASLSPAAGPAAAAASVAANRQIGGVRGMSILDKFLGTKEQPTVKRVSADDAMPSGILAKLGDIAEEDDGTVYVPKPGERLAPFAKRNYAAIETRDIRCSPYKLNDVAKMIRGLSADVALRQLTLCPRRVGREVVLHTLREALKLAAESYKLERSRLFVWQAFVGKGVYLKRITYHNKGRHGKRFRYFSRLTLVLALRPTEEQKAAAAAAEKAKKAAPKKKRMLVRIFGGKPAPTIRASLSR